MRYLSVLLALTLACGTENTVEASFKCVAGGSPPPTDCAFVQAIAQDGAGNRLGFLPVRVDSVITGTGTVYTSSSTTTAGDGGFTLLVFRIQRVQSPSVPDTATVRIRGYSDPNPVAGTTPSSLGVLQMKFSPLGAEVSPTNGIVVFTPIPPS